MTVFHNKILESLSKSELEKILDELARGYNWTIKDNIVIEILSENNDLLERYRYIVNNTNLLIEIDIIINTKIKNFPFYFALYLYPEVKTINYVINYQKTSIDILKKFHNDIKRSHLQEVIKKLKLSGTSVNNIFILDLCCGKGNDVAKWHSLGINNGIGIDISQANIEEARYRFLEKNYIQSFKVNFFTADVGINSRDLYTFLDYSIAANHGRKFDIITCNFAVHYLYKHSDHLHNFMRLIKTYLKSGGYFIGTTLNKELILKLLHNKTEFISPLLEIRPESPNFFNNNIIYNRKYSIRIGIPGENTYFNKEDSIEYLVDFNELRTVANKHGLSMINFSNFKMLYKDSYNMSDGEKSASFLNSKFTFFKQF